MATYEYGEYEILVNPRYRIGYYWQINEINTGYSIKSGTSFTVKGGINKALRHLVRKDALRERRKREWDRKNDLITRTAELMKRKREK